MKLLLSGITLLVILLALAGCDGKHAWTLRLTDTHDNPITGAKVCVWSYPIDQQHPLRDAAQIGRSWERGELPMQGWFFHSDKTGLVSCTGFPTGHEVVTGYTPGHVVYEPGVTIVHGYGRRDGRWGDRDVFVYRDQERYIPPRAHYRWKAGDWLAVTITAEGYQPYHFAFRPDGKSGDLGTIELQASNR